MKKWLQYDKVQKCDEELQTRFGGMNMPGTSITPARKNWTASELRKLPPHQRDEIMEAAAALAEGEYRSDPALTAFEAFGEEDLHADSADTETR